MAYILDHRPSNTIRTNRKLQCKKFTEKKEKNTNFKVSSPARKPRKIVDSNDSRRNRISQPYYSVSKNCNVLCLISVDLVLPLIF